MGDKMQETVGSLDLGLNASGGINLMMGGGSCQSLGNTVGGGSGQLSSRHFKNLPEIDIIDENEIEEKPINSALIVDKQNLYIRDSDRHF